MVSEGGGRLGFRGLGVWCIKGLVWGFRGLEGFRV